MQEGAGGCWQVQMGAGGCRRVLAGAGGCKRVLAGTRECRLALGSFKALVLWCFRQMPLCHFYPVPLCLEHPPPHFWLVLSYPAPRKPSVSPPWRAPLMSLHHALQCSLQTFICLISCDTDFPWGRKRCAFSISESCGLSPVSRASPVTDQ